MIFFLVSVGCEELNKVRMVMGGYDLERFNLFFKVYLAGRKESFDS